MDEQRTDPIAELCDHAGKLRAFFDEVLSRYVHCEDHDAADLAKLEVRLACRDWRSDTGITSVVREAVDTSRDPVEKAIVGWRAIEAERRRLLDRIDTLQAAAVRACHQHGELTRAAYAAVMDLIDALRALWAVTEYGDWCGHRAALLAAIREARVFAVGAAGARAHEAIAKRLKGNPLEVLVYLVERGAKSATEQPSTRALTARSLTMTEDQVSNALRSLRKTGSDHGMMLVDSTEVGTWATPDGYEVARHLAADVAKRERKPRLKVRGCEGV